MKFLHLQVAALKEEAMQRNENSSIEKENKNNQNQLKKTKNNHSRVNKIG